MRKQVPVFLGFFVMGFVDVVGIATNYAKKDLHLHDSVANLLPLMVFLWFALFSVPTGVWMNRIGRRKAVVSAMAITLVALLVPLVAYNFAVLLAAFALIGIGNTILQVSLNPLLTDVVQPQRLTSALTGGQLIKAIASFLGPVIAGAASIWFGEWKLIFPVFAGVTVINTVWLWSTPIAEHGFTRASSAEPGHKSDRPTASRSTTILDCLRLLRDPLIVQLLFGVVAIVGLDVGFNTTLPKFLMARNGLPLEKAGLGTSLYFIARTTGSLAGVIILAKAKARRIFLATTICGALALAGLLLSSPLWLILSFIFLLGFSVANVFPILFAAALQRAPDQANEVSGLLIMGVSGGAILLPIMGIIGDAKGSAWALGFLLVAWGYLVWVGRRLQ